MRNLKWLLVASLAVATTGCVETVDANYPSGGGYGYANSGYSNGYYAPTYYAPAYTASRGETYYAPQVVRETRVVPVPQARPTHEPQPQHQADRGPANGDHGNHGPQQDHRDHNGQDRDGDGRPDRRS